MTGGGDSFVHDLTVQDGRMYACAWDSGLWIYDVTNVATAPPSFLVQAPDGGNDTTSAWPSAQGDSVDHVPARRGGGARGRRIREGDASVISTPEYNKNPSGVLKHALDWVSRVRPVALAGKPVAVLSAAAGLAGGQRATAALWLMLIPFKVRLVAEAEVAVGNAGERFDADGRLTGERLAAALERQMAALRAASG